jgi:hypothetical protein
MVLGSIVQMNVICQMNDFTITRCQEPVKWQKVPPGAHHVGDELEMRYGEERAPVPASVYASDPPLLIQ